MNTLKPLPDKTSSMVKIDDCEVTSSETIGAWDTTAEGAPKVFYRKSITLKVVGKTSIMHTKNSALLRAFLSNGSTTFTIVVWRDCIEKLASDLKINNVVYLNNLKVSALYPSDLTKNVWPGGEFVATKETTIVVKKKGQIEEYPAANLFPPYWRDLCELNPSDKEIALRVKILSTPTLVKVESMDFVSFWAGDRKSNKSQIRVKLQQDELDFIGELEKGKELIVFGGSACNENQKLVVEVATIEYLMLETEPKMEKIKSYSEVTFKSPAATPMKKPRKSFF